MFPPTPVESDWSSDEESEDMISLMKESPVRCVILSTCNKKLN